MAKSLPVEQVSCTECLATVEAAPKLDFLGLNLFSCPSCQKTFRYPMSASRRRTYIGLSLLVALAAAAMYLVAGLLPLPGVLSIALLLGLNRDSKVRKKVEQVISETEGEGGPTPAEMDAQMRSEMPAEPAEMPADVIAKKGKRKHSDSPVPLVVSMPGLASMEREAEKEPVSAASAPAQAPAAAQSPAAAPAPSPAPAPAPAPAPVEPPAGMRFRADAPPSPIGDPLGTHEARTPSARAQTSPAPAHAPEQAPVHHEVPASPARHPVPPSVSSSSDDNGLLAPLGRAEKVDGPDRVEAPVEAQKEAPVDDLDDLDPAPRETSRQITSEAVGLRAESWTLSGRTTKRKRKSFRRG